MAEIASPASDPRSLRRHYPHQVQGVVQLDLSAIAAPPHFFVDQNKTDTQQVNKACPCRAPVSGAWRFTETPYNHAAAGE